MCDFHCCCSPDCPVWAGSAGENWNRPLLGPQNDWKTLDCGALRQARIRSRGLVCSGHLSRLRESKRAIRVLVMCHEWIYIIDVDLQLICYPPYQLPSLAWSTMQRTYIPLGRLLLEWWILNPNTLGTYCGYGHGNDILDLVFDEGKSNYVMIQLCDIMNHAILSYYCWSDEGYG